MIMFSSLFTRPVISRLRVAAAIVILLMLSGCSQLVANAKKEFASNISATILNDDDPETIRQALPAYMVLESSMIRSDPDNVELLVSGSQLYGAYASVFVDNKVRKRVLAGRAFDYASHAVCVTKPIVCNIRKVSYHEFEQSLKQFNQPDAARPIASNSE